MWKAWGAVAVAVSSFALSLYLISVCPWPLLPFAWAFAGTAMTGVRRAKHWRGPPASGLPILHLTAARGTVPWLPVPAAPACGPAAS